MNSLVRITVRGLALGTVLTCSASVAADTRQLVTMPAAAQEALREEMVGFMSALHEIVSLLGENKLAAAAEVADNRLGMKVMGRHRGAPADAIPGRHMPAAMHEHGRNLHIQASEFAKIARTGDSGKALAALQPITAACVGCHSGYRLR